MISHFESMYIDMWDVEENGNHIPFDVELNENPRQMSISRDLCSTPKLVMLYYVPFLKKDKQKSTTLEVQSRCGHTGHNI